jgi:hypothetical protein
VVKRLTDEQKARAASSYHLAEACARLAWRPGLDPDVLLSQASLQRGVYTPAALQSMLDHSGVGGRQLWGALCLELWHQRYIDG